MQAVATSIDALAVGVTLRMVEMTETGLALGVVGSVGVIGLMTFVELWNEYMTPILYLDNYPTLMSGLFRYKTVATYTLDTPVYFAGLLLAALPTGILFTCFSGTLMRNLTIGGIKG